MKKYLIKERFKTLDTIRYFRKNSVFFRFYILNLLIALLMIIIASAYISELIDQNNRAKTRQINNQQVERTMDQVDNSIFFMDRILQSVANSKYIVDAVIRPNPTYTDRNQDVISYLRSVNRNNSYISKIWVYEDTLKTLFSSGGSVTHLREGDFSTIMPLQILEKIDLNPATVILSESSTNRSILTIYDSEIYLCYQSITATWGGYHSSVIAKLNGNYLFSNIITRNDALNYGMNVCQDSTLLYSNLDADSELNQQSEQIAAISSVTRWKYIVFPRPYERTGLTFVLKEIIPFLMIAVFFSLGCALVIAQSLYSPISSLTKHFWKYTKQERNGNDRSDNNEIDFLYRGYSAILRDKERAEYLIQEVQPEMERKLFAALIDGVEYDSEQLALQLNDMRSAFSPSGYYRIFFIRLEMPEKSEDLASYLAIRDIEYGMIDLLTKKRTAVQYIQRNQYGILLIQHMPGLSREQAESIEKKLEQQIYQMLNAKGVVYTAVWSAPFSHLLELHKVCMESNAAIRRHIYMCSGPEQEEESTADEPRPQPSLEVPLRALQELLDKNKISEAEHQLQEILRLIAQQSARPAEAYSKLLDTLVERSIQMHAEKQFDTENYQKLYHTLQTVEDPEILAADVETAAHQVFESIKLQALRRQNRFISKAKEYVEENYANGDLSVQMIAEHLGISASYLSNLFTTLTGETLVSYINHYRVEVAIHLLQSTTISIKEIGFKTGFNTAQNFNRVFKRITGKNPGLFRENRKEGSIDQ